MKLKLFGIAAVVSLAIAGCKLLDELRTFDMSYAVDFTVPSSTIIDLPFSMPTTPITTNSDQRFEDEGVESEWIESVKLNSLVLTITAPEGDDFSLLETISLYMRSDNEAEVLIADMIPVPADAGNTITLDVKDADLYPCISQNNFTLRTALTTDETMTHSIDFRADMVIEVKATIPGGN
jgi:hypothetical protein